MNALIQPSDHGIIQAFNTYYRSDMWNIIIDTIDEGQENANVIANNNKTVLEIIHMAHIERKL